MIDKKWIAAGYAAALVIFLLLVLLLWRNFLHSPGGDQKEEAAGAVSFAGKSGGDSAQTPDDDIEIAQGGEEAGAQEESAVFSSAEGRPDEDREAEILSLQGSDLWKRFEGAVLTGDSRVVGFSLYTDIPDSSIFAENGATIDALDDFRPGIAARDPKCVFVAYGINDIISEVGGKTAGAYAAYAEEKIGKLEAALGDAEIFVNSILPVSASLDKSDGRYRKVEEYNKELRQMCLRRGWHYVDNSTIAVNYADLYAGDGIHLQADFYEHWGRRMLLTESEVLKHEGGTGVDR